MTNDNRRVYVYQDDKEVLSGMNPPEQVDIVTRVAAYLRATGGQSLKVELRHPGVEWKP